MTALFSFQFTHHPKIFFKSIKAHVIFPLSWLRFLGSEKVYSYITSRDVLISFQSSVAQFAQTKEQTEPIAFCHNIGIFRYRNYELQGKSKIDVCFLAIIKLNYILHSFCQIHVLRVFVKYSRKDGFWVVTQ